MYILKSISYEPLYGLAEIVIFGFIFTLIERLKPAEKETRRNLAFLIYSYTRHEDPSV